MGICTRLVELGILVSDMKKKQKNIPKRTVTLHAGLKDTLSVLFSSNYQYFVSR